jgi:hypothetical protein
MLKKENIAKCTLIVPEILATFLDTPYGAACAEHGARVGRSRTGGQ